MTTKASGRRSRTSISICRPSSATPASTDRRQPREDIGRLVLPVERRRQAAVAATGREADLDRLGGRARRGGGEQRPGAVAAADLEDAGEGCPGDGRRVAADQPPRGGVDLDEAVGRGIDDQHRLGRQVEQQAVARLGLAQAEIVALHRLLRLEQPLLHRRGRAQVAAERDDLAVVARPDGHEAQRQRCSLATSAVAAQRWLTIRHRPRPCGGVVRSMSSTLNSLSGPTVSTQRRPSSGRERLAREFGAGDRDVADHAVAVDDQRDVGGDRRQPRGETRIEGAERRRRRGEIDAAVRRRAASANDRRQRVRGQRAAPPAAVRAPHRPPCRPRRLSAPARDAR